MNKKNIAGPEKSGQVETWPTWPVATALNKVMCIYGMHREHIIRTGTLTYGTEWCHIASASYLYTEWNKVHYVEYMWHKYLY